jgi:twitching motility protein PilT
VTEAKKVLTVEEIARKAMEKGASDIHLTVSRPPIVRIHGKLQIMEEYEPLTPDDTFQLGNELMANEKNRNMIGENGHADFSSTLPELGRVRVNIYLQRGSYAIAIRIIPMKIPDI